MMFIKVQSLEMHMSIMAEMKQEWSMPMSDKMLVHEFYSLEYLTEALKKFPDSVKSRAIKKT